MKKCHYILFFLLVPLYSVWSQPQTNITSFSYAGLLYNPAFAGMQDDVNITTAAKSQWNGINSHPSLIGVSAHIPVNYERVGVGINLLEESTILARSYYVNGNISYKINFMSGRLSFGLRLGLLQRSENFVSLTIKDPDDPQLMQGLNKWYPETGGGIFYKSKKYFGGISFSRTAGIYMNYSDGMKNHYYLSAGAKQKISEEIFCLPAFQAKYTLGFTPQATFLLPFEYKEIILFGPALSTTSVFSLMAGINITHLLKSVDKSVVLFYSYDQSVRKTNYWGNTNEIVLTIKLIRGEPVDRILKRKITVSPLFFD